MPFDGTHTTPSLRALADLLRHPEDWPERFGPWDYSDCRTCAMGLAFRMKWVRQPYDHFMGEGFHLNRSDATAIFRHLHQRRADYCMSNVTPEDVADAIDKHLAKVELKAAIPS